MKYISFFITALLCITLAQAQSGKNLLTLPNGHYVVIAKFQTYESAEAYSDKIFSWGYEETSFGYQPDQEKYVVFTYASEDQSEAQQQENYFRNNKIFPAARLTSVTNSYNRNQKRAPQRLPDPLPEKESAVAKKKKEKAEVAKQPEPEPKPQVKQVEKRGNQSDYYYIKPYVYNIRTNDEVITQVDLVNSEEAKKIEDFLSDTVYAIRTDRADQIKLLVNHFGFKKSEQDVDLEDFSSNNSEVVSKFGDTIAVRIPLVRFDKGDIITMYNVFFWSDAAVMKETSLYELNSLLEMLKENPDLEIKIHGHTNGNSMGTIYTVKEGSDNFFTRVPENDQSIGSAKKLSEERARIIKRWLTSQGIDESRMEVEGWGGKKMLYASDSPNARKNLRVEVEVLKK